MGNRNPILWILTSLAVTTAALCDTSVAPAAAQAGQGGALNVGTSARESTRIGVTWTLRDRDLFACESAAYDLRALVREHGGRVAIRAIAIDADPGLVTSFLRKERLQLQVSYLSAQQYRRAYGGEPVPSVAVSQRGRLVELLNTGQLHVRGRRDTRSLQEVVAQLLSTTHLTLAYQ
jgi:hypothetical protein